MILFRSFWLRPNRIFNNIKTFKKLNKIADKLTNNPDLNDAISNQNASKSFNIIQEYLLNEKYVLGSLHWDILVNTNNIQKR